MTLTWFSHPLLAITVTVGAAMNVGQAADNPLRTKYAQPDFQAPAVNIQSGFAEDWVPSRSNLFEAGNFGRQFRVRYEDTEELGNNEFSATAWSGSFEPALIETDKEPIGASHWANFHGLFAAQLHYDIHSLWLTDDVEGGVDPDINSYDTQELELPATYGAKRSGLAGGRIAPLSLGNYIESSVSGADRAWYHRVAYPQFTHKF